MVDTLKPTNPQKKILNEVTKFFLQEFTCSVDLVFNSLPIPEYSTEYGMQVRAKLFPAKPREPVNSSFEGENSQHQSDGLYKEDIPF